MIITTTALWYIAAILTPIVSAIIAAIAILRNLERARRELAVNLIYNWAKDTDWLTARAIQIAKELPWVVVDEIDRRRAVVVPGEHYEGIISILEGTFSRKCLPLKPVGSTTTFAISSEHSAFVRFLWLRWLNRLEGTLAAWHQGAAASELMSREFAPLVVGASSELEVLTKVRMGLPVITEFCEQIQKTGRITVRPRLGIFPWR